MKAIYQEKNFKIDFKMFIKAKLRKIIFKIGLEIKPDNYFKIIQNKLKFE